MRQHGPGGVKGKKAKPKNFWKTTKRLMSYMLKRWYLISVCVSYRLNNISNPYP